MVRREQAGELERQLQEVIDKARKGRGGGDTGMTHVARKARASAGIGGVGGLASRFGRALMGDSRKQAVTKL